MDGDAGVSVLLVFGGAPNVLLVNIHMMTIARDVQQESILQSMAQKHARFALRASILHTQVNNRARIVRQVNTPQPQVLQVLILV